MTAATSSQQSSKPPHRLTREQVVARYAPCRDPNWTPEREAAFFESLPTGKAARTVRRDVPWQVKDYAEKVLGAVRVSASYASTLCAILIAFAAADAHGTELRLTQRMEQYGPPQTMRTIQAQLLQAGLLVKVVREQGGGFVGPVHVYAPTPPVRFSPATWADWEAMCRACERGPTSYPDEALALSGIESVPF
jgi:hypothetical protein